jgi:hypothetical protein
MGLGLVKVNCAKNSNLCATTLCPIALVSTMHCLAEPTVTVTLYWAGIYFRKISPSREPVAYNVQTILIDCGRDPLGRMFGRHVSSLHGKATSEYSTTTSVQRRDSGIDLPRGQKILDFILNDTNAKHGMNATKSKMPHNSQICKFLRSCDFPASQTAFELRTSLLS